MEKQKKLQNDLELIIREAKEKYVDADIKISAYDIKSGISASVNGKRKGWAASIIKVPVMVSVLQEVEKGNLNLDTRLPVNHRLMLEEDDYVSSLPEGSTLKVEDLLNYMIVNSDNEATNILIDNIGGPKRINRTMRGLGSKRSMLGHLLCPNVPRYTHFFLNPDGSNITTPNDMVKIMRHIYDPSYKKLSSKIKSLSDEIMSSTYSSYIQNEKFNGKKVKAKIGVISDPVDGADIHEVGIIDNSLIVCLMANKIGQKTNNLKDSFVDNYFSSLFPEEIFSFNLSYSMPRTGEVVETYDKIMNTLGDHFGNGGINKNHSFLEYSPDY